MGMQEKMLDRLDDPKLSTAEIQNYFRFISARFDTVGAGLNQKCEARIKPKDRGPLPICKP